MSTIAVAGGTGTLGRGVVAAVQALGHEPRIVSRHPRPAGAATDAGWAVVDYKSGAGLADAFAGVDAVVVATGAMRDAAVVRAILDATDRSLHLVYVSIVGIERVPMPYYRAKLSAERVLEASQHRWTILRATQFHTLALSLVRAITRLPVALVPRGASLQPVSAAEVAQRLAALSTGEPGGRVADFGGPQVRPVADLVEAYLTAAGRGRRVRQVRVPGRMMRAVADGALLAPDHRDGTQTFEQFLVEHVQR